MPFIAHRIFDWIPIEIDQSWNLRTIKTGKLYSICKTLGCELCNHIFLDIRFDNKEMMKLYKDYRGEQYTRLRMLYEPDYAARNNELEKKYSYIDKVDEFILQSLTEAQLYSIGVEIQESIHHWKKKKSCIRL